MLSAAAGVGAAAASLAGSEPAGAQTAPMELGESNLATASTSVKVNPASFSDFPAVAMYGIGQAKTGVIPLEIFGVVGDSEQHWGVVGLSFFAGVYGACQGFSGLNTGSNQDNYPAGVIGDSNSADGVTGLASANNGVFGLTSASSQNGVYGQNVATSAVTGAGVAGIGSAGSGVYGVSVAPSGFLYSDYLYPGVKGDSNTHDGVTGHLSMPGMGSAAIPLPTARVGSILNSTAGPGVTGYTSVGAHSGVYGECVGASGLSGTAGVKGDSNTHDGVTGLSSAGNGVSGYSAAYGGSGVYGKDVSADGGFGVNGYSEHGIGVLAGAGFYGLGNACQVNGTATFSRNGLVSIPAGQASVVPPTSFSLDLEHRAGHPAELPRGREQGPSLRRGGGSQYQW